jgi:GNAT superfamily N-acetyltransferase
VTTPAGFTVRPIAAADAAAVAELVNVFDRAYVEEADTVDAAEVASWWVRIDLQRDTRLFVAADGAAAASAVLYERIDGALDLDGYVHPDWTGRGLGGSMIDWLEEETVRRGFHRARTGALTADPGAGRLIADRGYNAVRRFYRMAIDLDSLPSEPDWPPGFTVSEFQPGEEAILHAVTEEAFAEHWGHVDRDLDDWRKTVFGAPWWDPSLVHLVREGNEVVAAAVNAIRFGGGFVGTIGTLKPWRGRGIGRALLLTAFGEFYRRGETRVTLAVDAGNETGATHLYESVGMRAIWQADAYEKHV